MIIGIPAETFAGERRVALTPSEIGPIKKAGAEVLFEPGAGTSAGFPDKGYLDKGARLARDRAEVFTSAEIILQIRTPGANPSLGITDLSRMRLGQVVVGLMEPFSAKGPVQALAERGVTAFALDLIPRITRAQSMDVLSSQATVAGYKSVIIAAEALPRMFPLLMTAAGTITPARVLVMGAGVAGLQAIATARRLGAVVQAYDVRPAVKEQVQSLGAKFVELELKAEGAEDRSGYAKAMDEEFYRRQRELLTKVVAASDAVITTAAVPGKKAPVLVTGEMVRAMATGSVIVDLAAERGGNCELTRPDETIVEQGITILAPTNLPATVPYHASQMYSKNITAFLLNLIREGKLIIDEKDEIVRETLVTHANQIVHPRVREVLGI
jgi:H+-translocating NAD(P) transhydrogenase subunit alpha